MTISATTRGLRPGVCTSTTRPGSPFDGQLIYETDTNRVAVYDTNAWVYKTPASTTGSVLQVVSTTKSDTFTASGTAIGSAVDITGLTATITPLFATSKIVCVYFVAGAANYTGVHSSNLFSVGLYRTTTLIGQGDAASNRTRVTSTNGIGLSGAGMSINSNMFLDSPNTASAVTYKIAGINAAEYNATMNLYINRSVSDSDNAYSERPSSSLTLLEIAQ